MSALSERLAVARREAAAEQRARQSAPEGDAPDWDSLSDMARDLQDRFDQAPLEDSPEESSSEQGDPETNPLPSLDTSEGELGDPKSDTEDVPEELETERESRIDRARAAGAAALESIGVAAYGRLSSITDRMQARDDRKQEAQEDYERGQAERSVDQLIGDDKEILGQHADKLFRDRSRRAVDKIVGKVESAEESKDVVTRREKYLEMRSNITQVRINKLKARIENSPDNFFTRRLNGWRREKLYDLEQKNNKRARSTGDIMKKRQEKPEKLRKEIDDMVKKKIDAMYNKAQRNVMKTEHGIGRRHFIKRAEFIAKLTPEKKKQIMKEATLLVRKKNIERGRLDLVPDTDNADSMDI